MKKVSELMKDMGFNPKGSDAVKEAFVKHLIKQSTGNYVQTPSEKKIISENPQKFISLKLSEEYSLPTQLSFDLDQHEHILKKKTAI